MVKENLPVISRQELGITDDYMFFSVMQDDRICTRFLQELFPELKIKNLEVQAQKQIKRSKESKAVRLDVGANDDQGRVYDLEMQSKNRFKHKRVRYYRAITDANLLETGMAYEKLPPSIIVILSPFANVNSKKRVCCFRTYCTEEKIGLDDKSLIYIITSRGTEGLVSPTIQKFLDLMNGHADTSNDFIKEVCEKMSVYNQDVQWRNDRLAYKSTLSQERYEGEKRGKEEALVENLRSLVESGMAADEAMSRLKVPREKWNEYREKIEPQNV